MLLINNGLHLDEIDSSIYRRIEWDIKYEGYVKRQRLEVNKFKKLEKRKIPEGMNYDLIKGLSREAREKFSSVKPISIGQASRIPGISSCDASILMVHVERLGRVSRET